MSRFDRFAKLLRRPSSRWYPGGAIPLWESPADATSATLTGYWLAGSAGETYSGGHVTSSPDLSGNGNTMVIPASVAGATGPTYLTAGYRGLPAWSFNGTTDALARSTFVCPPAGAGAYTFVAFVQRVVTTASKRFMGFQNDRPFLNTNGEDTLAWGADGAPATIGTVNVDGLMGPSLVIGTFDPALDRQRLYTDTPGGAYVKLIGETANTDPGSSLNGGTIGFGYNGHPSTSAGAYFQGVIRGGCVYRGELSAEDCAELGRWWRATQRATRRGPILLGWLGQSNERADQSSNFVRRVVRRDVYAIRDSANYDSSGREQQAWAALNDTVLSGSLRGADIETIYQLVDELGIDCHLLNVAKSGTGFRLPADGTLDSTGWASPSVYGGDGALMWTRFRTAMDDMLTRSSFSTMHFHIGQKETDGLHATSAAAYEDSLADQIADLRSEYGAGITVSLPLLNPGATGVTYNAEIRAAQEAVAAGVSGVYGIDCDDQSIRVDGFHYEQAYHTALGERVAAHIDSLL